MTTPIMLTGRDLTLAELRAVCEGAEVELCKRAKEVMRASRAIVDQHLEDGIPVYGLNRGLGVRATEALPKDVLADFSMQMVRGRAQAWGEPLDVAGVRAFLVVRLNTLLTGEAGVSPHIADYLALALNKAVHPVMRRIGSIGAGDLVAAASAGHAFIGEGEILVDGEPVPAGQALEASGLGILKLGPKDGQALCNNTAFSAGLAAFATNAATRSLDGLFMAAALSLEGFRGNLSPLLDTVVRIRPQAGQVEAADRLMQLLEHSALKEAGTARRLQDPISTRALAQTLGSLLAEHELAEAAVTVEMNGSGDNPVVVPGEDRIVSTANFHLPHLSLRLDSLARALAWAACDSLSRVHRFMTPAVSGLPPLLSSHEAGRAGFGPLLKPAEALRAEIIHLANPVPILPSHNADGIEDAATFAAQAAMKLSELCSKLDLLTAFELAAGAQALDLAKPDRVAPKVKAIHKAVREHLPFIDEDRPVGREIEAIAEAINNGDLKSQA